MTTFATAQEALKERLKIPAFATPEIATVLFLQVPKKQVQVGGWSSRPSFLYHLGLIL